jgi:RimJ/RimL family protein N-acetyltransferase
MFSAGQQLATFVSKKGNEIEFRFPSLGDVEAITEYINELSAEDTFVTLSGEQMTLEQEREVVEKWLEGTENGLSFHLLAFFKGKVIGVAGLRSEGKRTKHVGVMGISVKEKFREEGIGREMLEKIVELGKQFGFTMIELAVYAPNERAQSLYTKMGFEVVGRIPQKVFFRGDFVDEIIMVKKLT